MAKWRGFSGRLERCCLMRGPLPGAPCRPALPRSRARGAASAAQAASPVRGEERLKGPAELPGPGLLGSVYWLFLRGYLLHTHRLQVGCFACRGWGGKGTCRREGVREPGVAGWQAGGRQVTGARRNTWGSVRAPL